MPIHKIEVTEYECIWCHYRWINRVNGKDGPIPQRCAKCKRYYWNTGEYVGRNPNPITDEERGLRMRLYKFEGKRHNDGKPFELSGYVFAGIRTYQPNELCKKFLSLKPRPTIEQLKYVLQPMGWDLRKFKGFVLDPETRKAKYDPQAYEKLLEEETQKRREYMQKVIDSRKI